MLYHVTGVCLTTLNSKNSAQRTTDQISAIMDLPYEYRNTIG